MIDGEDDVAVGMTKARQQTLVGEGLALGCLAAGRESFNGQKMSVELAFQHAWQHWTYRDRFPAVHAGLDRNDLLGIINKSPRRVSSHLVGWSNQWPFVPYLAEEWSLEEVAEILASEAGVPLTGWQELARAFLEDLDRAQAASR